MNGASFHYIAFRREAVKAGEGKTRPRNAVASGHRGEVPGVHRPRRGGDDIFGAFGADEGWIVSNFPTLLRDKVNKALGIELRDGIPVDADGRKLKQHSLRGSFHTAMNDAEIPEAAQRILVGRKGRDVPARVYATDMDLAKLYGYVCKVKPLAGW